jgi:hypothetical protein
MTYIYRGSFIAPSKPGEFADGRAEVLGAIARLHKGAPLSRAMQKRAAAAAGTPSAFGAEADETLDEIKKAHATGRRPGLPGHTAKGDERINLKSVNMVKRAHANPLRVTGSRPLTARELNQHFTARHADMQKGWDIPSDRWNAMTPQERRRWAQKMKKAGPRTGDREVTDNYGRGARESGNGNWDDTHANTGATNDWHDQIVPATKPTRITFPQFNAPGQSARNDAIEAIKQDLSKPKRLGQNPNADDSFARG